MQVLTPFGYRDIDDVEIGDELVYFDTQTGKKKHATRLKKISTRRKAKRAAP